MLTLAVAIFSQRTAQFAILGLASGAMFGLVALGIVVAYRSSQVLNFSSAAFGAVAAFLFYDLWGHMPWPLALAISLVLGGALGALTALACACSPGPPSWPASSRPLGCSRWPRASWTWCGREETADSPTRSCLRTSSISVPPWPCRGIRCSFSQSLWWWSW